MISGTTIGCVASRQPVLVAGSTCAVVDETFQRDRERLSVLVDLGGGSVTLVNRRAFYQAMTGRLGYGRTLFYEHAVVDAVESDTLELPSGTALEEAALLAVTSRRVGSGDDVLVRFPDGWGSVAATDLFQHVADLCRNHVEQVRHSEQRFRALVEKAKDVIVIVDRDTRVLYHSRQTEGFTSMSVGDHAFTHVIADDAADLAVAFQRIVAHPDLELDGEFGVRAEDGTRRTFEYNARNLLGDPAVGGIVVHYRDVTQRRALEDELRYSALHDPLTGAANRSLLFDRLSYSLDRLSRVPGSVSVLYCDLDGFKQVNDQLGHLLGDLVLTESARRLSSALRRGDTLSRFGGDEFVIIAEDCGTAEAAELADRVLCVLAESLEIEGHVVPVTVSVGVSTTSTWVQPSALLKQADLAMYRAKLAGRNRVATHTGAEHDRELRSRRLAGDLRTATVKAELHLVYQPIFTAQGSMAGAEALLRWTHPDLGAISPDEIIPIAEAEGLIARIGRWAIDDACRTLAEWSRRRSGPGWVGVNVSAEQLDDAGLLEHLARALHTHGLMPSQLHLELTESAVAEGVEHRLEMLRRIRALGVAVALDDFGTGYSSLSSISHLPLDIVKIDRAFVADLGRVPESTAVLRGIVELAHTLGFRVVAEGVERIDELRVLREVGCDYVQGFLLGHPDHPDALADLGPHAALETR